MNKQTQGKQNIGSNTIHRVIYNKRQNIPKKREHTKTTINTIHIMEQVSLERSKANKPKTATKKNEHNEN